jgi:hypothetical protein|tara:strand:- start:50 stop:274 length:225 start_codon:yes stop_codon:yes gene_type:complete
MLVKKERVKWLPQLPDTDELGWLAFDDSTIWKIMKIHNFDDLGCTLDTFTIMNGAEVKEIYSYDEGETFTYDVY